MEEEKEMGMENDFAEGILDDLENYLSSSIFHQVGPKTAKKVVSAFGVKTVQVIEKSPRELNSVRGVGKYRVMSIRKGWAVQKNLKKACMILMKKGGEKNETGNRE